MAPLTPSPPDPASAPEKISSPARASENVPSPAADCLSDVDFCDMAALTYDDDNDDDAGAFDYGDPVTAVPPLRSPTPDAAPPPA
eukprot:CAMPEP_0194333808 /NCGR_PEP_ID=MMETSP0171-20130528/63968_1 /TAXON_ID=218684 /ORGANISM="Corethron pennatum, Strain L29A3" /LENGTH=84 /DNA_ID=CAMNT_0039096187 /DNA_START=142 /DNA_END=392 /DNA_ORIENTATION=+